MSTTTKYELLQALRVRYLSSSRHDKKRILDEFCSFCEYNRKYAIRLFNSDVTPRSKDTQGHNSSMATVLRQTSNTRGYQRKTHDHLSVNQ